MTTLHDRLAGGTAKTACKLCAFLAKQTPEVVAEWQAELALPPTVVGHTAVVNELKRLKMDVTEVSVRRHRSRHVTR